MYHPSRGGVRGGRDQFNWDDVKADKHRENYLGHSVKAPVGRWQKGKDLLWYARDNKQTAAQAADAARTEIERIKHEEEAAMMELLGLAPKRDKRLQGSRLDRREQEELFKRGKAGEEVDPTYAEGERVQGLGYAPAPAHEKPEKKELLQSEGGPVESPLLRVVGHSEKQKEAENPSASKQVVSPPVSEEDGGKHKKKGEKRAKKEERKEEKGAIKQARREESRYPISRARHRRKDHKEKRRHDSDSSDEEPVKLDHSKAPSDVEGRGTKVGGICRGERERETIQSKSRDLDCSPSDNQLDGSRQTGRRKPVPVSKKQNRSHKSDSDDDDLRFGERVNRKRDGIDWKEHTGGGERGQDPCSKELGDSGKKEIPKTKKSKRQHDSDLEDEDVRSHKVTNRKEGRERELNTEVHRGHGPSDNCSGRFPSLATENGDVLGARKQQQRRPPNSDEEDVKCGEIHSVARSEGNRQDSSRGSDRRHDLNRKDEYWPSHKESPHRRRHH